MRFCDDDEMKRAQIENFICHFPIPGSFQTFWHINIFNVFCFDFVCVVVHFISMIDWKWLLPFNLIETNRSLLFNELHWHTPHTHKQHNCHCLSWNLKRHILARIERKRPSNFYDNLENFVSFVHTFAKDTYFSCDGLPHRIYLMEP